ncbi:cupredoxin domain-containing protein [Natronobacterium texcoconense]|uniref:Tat (Twin-arginine translocation) pathway signal sequence n=1 Tax=Natronobacterium texcoconense TaxID=1095778 RepID=A0A1H1IYJ9_NATTX|nr:plastocyanin/azurin family copper-binding protein [Natronobacterium texcoconense]SDR42358.1 Tat (twin-arginine translocation) pathway signal sequence [Natronobacterium texcoconense]
MTTTPITRRRLLQTTAAGTTLALAGCLSRPSDDRSDDEDDGTGELGSPTGGAEVVTTSTPYPQFDPWLVHVTVGGTVTWINEDGRHDVTSYHPDTHGPQRIPDEAEPWASDQLSREGDSFERTFDREGVYDYADTRHVCTSHEHVGAVGRVVVGWPDPDDEPALEEPQPALPTQAQNAFETLNEETRPVIEAGP